jgi:Helix-turn-helix domain
MKPDPPSPRSTRRSTAQRATGPRVPDARIPVGHRFNPYRLFYGTFIPEGVSRYRAISMGAKMVYGRLCRYAGEGGNAHPSIEALAFEVGLGETQAREYLRELERARFITSETRTDDEGRQTSNQYFFLWHEAFEGSLGEARKKPGAGVRKTEPPTPRISEPWRVRKTEPEENHHQESHRKESQEKPRQDPGKQTVALAPQHLQGPEETPKPIPLKADDENPKAPSAKRTAFDDPRQEFRARVSERHPEADPEYVLDCLSRELSGKNLSLKDFLDFDSRCTTNPDAVKNPAGYYLGLARRLNAQLEAAAFDERRMLNDRMNAFLAVPDPFRTSGPKCPVCHGPEGKGVVLSDDRKSFEPCTCATTEFAAELRAKEAARRSKAIQEAAAKENATEAA